MRSCRAPPHVRVLVRSTPLDAPDAHPPPQTAIIPRHLAPNPPEQLPTTRPPLAPQPDAVPFPRQLARQHEEAPDGRVALVEHDGVGRRSARAGQPGRAHRGGRPARRRPGRQGRPAEAQAVARHAWAARRASLRCCSLVSRDRAWVGGDGSGADLPRRRLACSPQLGQQAFDDPEALGQHFVKVRPCPPRPYSRRRTSRA